MKLFATSFVFGTIDDPTMMMNVLSADNMAHAIELAKQIHIDLGEPMIYGAVEIEKEA